MSNIEGKTRLNILVINFPEEKRPEILAIVERQGHFADFCTMAESYKRLIRVFPDYIITYTLHGDENLKESLDEIIKIADDLIIPLVIIEASLSDNTISVQTNDSISSIMSSPFGKNFFFKYVDKTISYLSENKKLVLNADSTILFNSLLSALVSQRRLDVDSITENDIYNKHIDNYKSDRENRDIEDRLWTALENRKFRLHYQPVISLPENKISGFEALIRMIDDDGSIISPDRFIKVAEESALIFPLGLWIVEETCRQINSWKEKFYIDTELRVNVNISPRQFIFPHLTESIFRITDQYKIGPEDIAFEITESALMSDMESANIALLEFRSKNFLLYMDDFGTGYSSLSYLMHFPVNVIKIDQSFVKWMHLDEQSEAIVKSIISLAHNLGLKVVAEGTDDELHIELLKNFGCNYAQGYFFAKPLPPDDADVFLEKYFRKK